MPFYWCQQHIEYELHSLLKSLLVVKPQDLKLNSCKIRSSSVYLDYKFVADVLAVTSFDHEIYKKKDYKRCDQMMYSS